MLKLLVVEDHQDTADALVRLLRAARFDVTLASDGRRALACVAARPVDLIITDVLMPEMDGLELVRSLRRQHPQIPVIAISAGGSHLTSAMLLQTISHMGAQRVLFKPVDFGQLLAAIAELCPARPDPAPGSGVPEPGQPDRG